MSNTRAIAAVTATMKKLLMQVNATLRNGDPPDSDLSDLVVTTKSPDKARDSATTGQVNQLNLFLYAIQPDATLRNWDQYQTGGGQLSLPLALKLFYMLTAYGDGNDDTAAQRLMGRAMAILNDQCVLDQADIKSVVPNNDLYRQIERVRITQHIMSTDEMSKLWTIFQTGYSLSVAYEASVVLLDDLAAAIAPQPVLMRGRGDPGPSVNPNLVPLTPTLTGLTLPRKQPAVRLGDTITLAGFNLVSPGATTRIDLRHYTQTAEGGVTPDAGGTATELQLTLSLAPVSFPAGVYTVSVNVDSPTDPDRSSNGLLMCLAPRIVSRSAGPRAPDGDVTITIGLTPEVWPDQTVSLLFDDQEIAAPARTGKVSSIDFTVDNPPSGTHNLRLRVDGVESLLVNYDVPSTPPAYDPASQIALS